MSINFNHVTNDISASSGSVSINGSVPGGGGGSSTITFNNISAAYTVVAGDAGKVVNCTSGTFTVSLTAAATLGSGFNCWIWNTGTGTITIDPNGAETLDGVATLSLRRGEGTQIVCDGTNWQTGDKKAMRGYAENLTSTASRPVASGSNSVAIGNDPGGSGSVASGLNSLAIIGTASAQNCVAIGANSGDSKAVAATGSGAMALGGSYASGTDSFAAGIGNNTSTYGAKATSAIALGLQAKATANYSVAISTAYQSNGALASGVACFAFGDSVTADGTNSFALGTMSSSSGFGKYVYGSGRFGANGDAQTGTFVLRRATTDATASTLSTDGNAGGASNQIILPNNSAYAFTGIIVARQQAAGGTASAAWKVEGLIRREGTAGTTTLVASTVTAISNVPGWTLALSADTTNGGLAVTATGAAATNIRWVATIETSEVTYA